MEAYPELEDQKKRYRELGFTSVFCRDMYDVYSKMLDGNDVKRISRIEWFDEFEEWHLIQAHYCLLVAAQGSFDSWFSELTKNASFSVSFKSFCGVCSHGQNKL